MADQKWLTIRMDERGEFDELVASNVDAVHLEMLDDGWLWMRFSKGKDAQVVRVHAKKREKLDIATEMD